VSTLRCILNDLCCITEHCCAAGLAWQPITQGASNKVLTLNYVKGSQRYIVRSPSPYVGPCEKHEHPDDHTLWGASPWVASVPVLTSWDMRKMSVTIRLIIVSVSLHMRMPVFGLRQWFSPKICHLHLVTAEDEYELFPSASTFASWTKSMGVIELSWSSFTVHCQGTSAYVSNKFLAWPTPIFCQPFL
jgi:hypothetical protein